MKPWAVVPVKSLRQAKSRLAPVLTPNQRATLGRALLARTLDVLTAQPVLAGVLVVSADPTALDLAKAKGAVALMEIEVSLNAALAQATAWLAERGAEATLVLPADLPLLSGEDVAGLVALAKPAPVVVLAPDRREQGTNALLSAPPGLIPYAFGVGSFARHRELCQARGVPCRLYRSPGLAFDVDVPEDLREWLPSLPPGEGWDR
jgi:2-phospho-L-lactate guanylyltransferase